jgi:MFS family permease
VNLKQDQQNSAQSSHSLWHNRDYLLLWLGQGVSSIGSGLTLFALPQLLIVTLNMPATAALVGALQTLPYVLFSLPAGALVDRWPRKRVMLICSVGLFCCIGSLPLALLSGHLTLPHIYLVAFLSTSLDVFYRLAELSVLKSVVDEAQLSTAVAQNELVYSLVILLGPALGGLLFSAGNWLPFVVDALTYLVLLVSLLRIRASLRTVSVVPEEERTRQGLQKLGREMWEGVRFLGTHSVLLSLTFLSGYIYLLLQGSVIAQILAHDMHIPSTITGLILGLGGVGNLLGALLGPVVLRRVRFGWALGGSFLLFTLVWPLYALASSAFALGAVVAGLAIVDSAIYILISTYRLTVIPDALQGRVIGSFRVLHFGFISLGNVLLSLALQHLPIRIVVLLLGAGLLICTAIALLSPNVRRATFPR